MKIKIVLVLFAFILLASGCTVVRQGEIGVKRKIGKLDPKIIQPGPVGFNPFVARIIKMPITTENIEITANLP